MTKKIRKIVAQALLITMVLPNISVRATENTVIDNTEQIVESLDDLEIKEETTENNVIEEGNSTNNDVVTEEIKEENNTTLEDGKNESETENDSITETTTETEGELEENSDINTIVEDDSNSLVGSKYEEIKLNEGIARYSVNEDFEREEFRLMAESMKEYTVLQTKTEDEYEVAFAYSDGSYSFVDSATTYEEAMSILESTPMPMSDENIEPVIISKSGQVTYSTNSMGQIVKYINGSVDPTFNNNTNVYTTKEMTSAFTYVNHGYVKDVPVIEESSKSAKIQVGGYTGWVNKDTASGNFDLEIVPLNQVKNPSYYISEGGVLYHFISRNLKANFNTNGSKIAIGVAPSYMVSGRVYLSYDGKYFYDGSNIQNGLNTLINDLKAGHNKNSVNANNPHYNYYQYLPFRSKTIYSASQLNKFIEDNTGSTSKLRGIGQTLKDAEKTYGVNALLALSIAINESGWGMSPISQSKNNIFGLNAVDTNPGLAANEFASVKDCINDFTKNWISRGYADPADWRYFGGIIGNKSLGANIKYASDPFWGEKAAKYAFLADLELSGGVSKLQDTNAYQLAICTTNNEVRNRNNVLLYKVNNNFNEYSSYVGVPFVITNPEVVNMNGRSSYEVYSDRNTAVNSGGTANKYHGNYNWADRGYISTSGVKFINTRRDVKPIFSTIGGDSRYNTAVELSKSKFYTADTVVLVNSSAIIDGVTASALATGLKAPILLADVNSLTTATTNELKRLGTKKVFLVGGEGVLGNGVINALKNIGITNITRLGGNSRYDTALQVAKYIDANIYDISEVFLVYGEGEADALTAGAISGQKNIPILLTGTKSINSQVKSFLSSESLQNAYVIGGTGVISDNALNELNSITANNISGNRLGGSNRFETNAKVIERFYGSNLNSIYISKGYELIDALTAGPIAAMDDSPIVIVGDYLTQAQKDVLSQKSAARIIQAGLGVSTTAVNTLRNLINIYCL